MLDFLHHTRCAKTYSKNEGEDLEGFKRLGRGQLVQGNFCCKCLAFIKV